jgi:TIR domain-containing protein
VSDPAALDRLTGPSQTAASGGLAAVAKLEVFLSHSTDDLAHVALVKRQIEALGIEVYLAEHDPRPGTSIAAKVEQAMRRCHAVVVLITQTSINSAYVQQEVGLARAFGKPIVPIVELGVEKSRLGMLGEVEYLELDLTQPELALASVSASLQPLVLAQISRVDVSLAVAQQAPEISSTVLVLGLGLLLGFLIASWAYGAPGAGGAA